jgi:histidinol-phosphate/aromatic aminotransferase/cobyric acid decarboxylase-like protein
MVRKWCHAWPVNETSQEAALQHAQHAEKVRQWHQSEWAHEAPEAASLLCTQVHRSQAAQHFMS